LGESSSSAQGENIKGGRRRTWYIIEGGEGLGIKGSNYTRSINGGSTAASSEFFFEVSRGLPAVGLGAKGGGKVGV
jgi:hypothetical protein